MHKAKHTQASGYRKKARRIDTMTKNISEKRLVDVLVNNYSKSSTLMREMRFYEKRIDLVVLPKMTGETIAIEAKVKNWGKAIGQAIVNLAAAEKSYIAIFSKYADNVPTSVLLQHGIGLISVGSSWGDVNILHEAKKSPFLNTMANNHLKARLIAGRSDWR